MKKVLALLMILVLSLSVLVGCQTEEAPLEPPVEQQEDLLQPEQGADELGDETEVELEEDEADGEDEEDETETDEEAEEDEEDEQQ